VRAENSKPVDPAVEDLLFPLQTHASRLEFVVKRNQEEVNYFLTQKFLAGFIEGNKRIPIN
jgi:hypothetical protein